MFTDFEYELYHGQEDLVVIPTEKDIDEKINEALIREDYEEVVRLQELQKKKK